MRAAGGGGLIIRGFDWGAEGPLHAYFYIRGASADVFVLLARLSERCGQLLLTPDSGAPAVVFDPALGLDPADLADAHDEAADWGPFFAAFYGG